MAEDNNKDVSFLTDKSVGGRFKRALAVALPSIALAKDNPYLVKSLYDKEEEFGKLDRQDARELIKSVASNVSSVITKNKATRKNRIDSNFESLNKIKRIFSTDGLSNAEISFIHDRGLTKAFTSAKKEYGLSSVKPLVSLIQEQTPTGSEDRSASKVPNMTLSELATAMAPAAKKLDLEMLNIRSQPASGPITSFVSGEMFSDEKGVDLTPTIRNIVKTGDVDLAEDDAKTKEIQSYLEGRDDLLTDIGKQAERISQMSAADKIPEKKMNKEMADRVGELLGISTDIDLNTGNIRFLTADEKLRTALSIISNDLTKQARELKITEANKLQDPRLLTNLEAVEMIFNKNKDIMFDDKDIAFDVPKEGSYLRKELEKRGFTFPDGKLKLNTPKVDKPDNKKKEIPGAPKVGDTDKTIKDMDQSQVVKQIKRNGLGTINGKDAFKELVKRNRQKYIDKINNFIKENTTQSLGAADIFKRNYSVRGFVESVIENLIKNEGMRINKSQKDRLIEFIIEDPAFKNPYKE
tara:strand:- start:3563 stop:5134 length:1572 start_codon:yes stop_codon:yes gene_type:complete